MLDHPHTLVVTHIWEQSFYRSRSRSWPTCTGVPGLNEAPDDGIALITGLLDALALLLIEAMLQENPDIGLLLIGIL